MSNTSMQVSYIAISGMAKTVLIMYAHQSAGSFNAAAKDAAVEVLTAQSCMVEVSDLYAMSLKPLLLHWTSPEKLRMLNTSVTHRRQNWHGRQENCLLTSLKNNVN